MCSTTVGNLYSKIVSLSTLFERQYVVPEYQRPYEWGIDQLDKMIDAISSDGDESKEYSFFGSLQFNLKEDNGKKQYEIVDGQQRIISFVLLASVLLGEEPEYNDKKWTFKKFSMRFENNVKPEILEENRNHLLQRKQSEWSYNNIADKTVFAEVVTVNETNPETLLSIFSSMNMEGLPLQREDIFKTKASSIFDGDSNSKEIISCINKQYEVIHKYNYESMTCDLSEYNIIDTFRYYVIEKCEELQNNKSMTKNPITLLTEEANKEIIKAKRIRTIDFENITKTIIETQRIIDAKNCLNYSKDQTIWFSRELIGESRYWNLRNIVYYIVYKISAKKGEPSESEVKTALELSERIWQFCSFFRAYYSKVVNEVYSTIINLVIKQSELQNPNEFGEILYKSLEVRSELRKALSDAVSKKCFNSNLPHLMVILSYFEDASRDKEATIEDIKKKLFYRWKYWKYNQNIELENGKTIEIEHIISQHWAKKEVNQVSEDTVHSIGNLMYLEQRINRALGDRLGNRGENIKSYKDDLSDIKMTNNDDLLRYQNSKMSCVKEFNCAFIKNGKEKVLELIEERGNRKKQFISELYEKNGFGSVVE